MNDRVWMYVAACLGSVACAAQPSVPTPPGEAVQCTDRLPARIVKLVHVDVKAGPDGPIIVPELCVVRSGTQVVWRTADDVLDPFELGFAESPGSATDARMAENGQKDFTSRRMGRRQEVLIIAKPVTAENLINYDVRIGTTHIDPGIKIMPR